MIEAMTVDPDLIARLTERADAEYPNRPAPVDTATLQRAEAAVGFQLHPLLAAAYQHIGDGGFGPDYQLMPLLGEPGSTSVVVEYLEARATGASTDWAWPEAVLPILTWGCGMYACVDCRSDEGTTLLFEPNPGVPDLAWYVDSPSLDAWFRSHLDDTGWWAVVEDGGDVDLKPWPDHRTRS